MPKSALAKKSPPTPKSRRIRAGSPATRGPAPQVTMHDLLAEPLLGVETAGGRAGASLPEVLAALGADEVRSFTGLQAHQQHAWHAFLVQLAAIALQRAGKTDPKQSAAAWCKLLLALTEERHEPWCLVVSDLSRPAFLQPPVPERTLAEFKEPIRRPDEIDVLVTSKNHDVKAARIAHARPEHWVYALVSLQTMQGYSGPKNHGIARMNGGFASRAGIGLSSGLDLAERWRRDVRALVIAREAVARDRYSTEGLALLWIQPWNGEKPLQVQNLDPYFIE